MQAGGATGLEDAIHLRTLVRNPRKRGLAEERAARLEEGIRKLDGVELCFPRQANAVFVELSEAVQTELRARGWHFYTFIGGAARFVCSWSSTPERIDQLVNDIEAAIAA